MYTHSERLSKYIGSGGAMLDPQTTDQKFFGHGKLLLSGEYFVMDGASALALPTKVGQSLQVRYSPSFDPKLTWKSYDCHGNLWFEASFEFWRFQCTNDTVTPEAQVLQQLLIQARKQNAHFLRDEVDVEVITHLGFPRDWGLGSSSTLIYNLAQWAYISPFELLFNTQGGSGYDIACAQSQGPIMYQKKSSGPEWSQVGFNPSFKENLYFVHLNKKQNSRTAIEYYKSQRPHSPEVISNISRITDDLVRCSGLEEFEFLINAHEDIVASSLKLTTAKKNLFDDFWGSVKSLGAWGGDFALVSSTRSQVETEEYFKSKGHDVILPYEDLILSSPLNSEEFHGKTLH